MSMNPRALRNRVPFLAAFFAVALFCAFPGNEAAAQTDNDTLDMEGNWMLSTGFSPGLIINQNAPWNYIPYNLIWTYEVHFDFDGPSAHGSRYLGHYVGFGSHPLGQPGAIVAETFYDNRGIQLVQLNEVVPGFNYVLLRNGKHQLYPDEPTRMEVVGGWVDIGGNIGNFTLVKLPGQGN